MVRLNTRIKQSSMIRSSEVAWRSLSRIHSLRDEDSLANLYGRKLISLYGDKAASYSQAVWAQYMTDGSLDVMLCNVGTGAWKAERHRVSGLTP